MNAIQQAVNQAAEIILGGYRAACEKGLLPKAELSAPVIEVPKDPKNGDYASSFAMQNAKALRLSPLKTAQAICENAILENTLFSEVTCAAPGFINLRLSHGWYESVLSSIIKDGCDYGKTACENPKKIMVEFVSANPTGPMHMGNARGGVLGDTLAEVLSRAGNHVCREFYVNDAGNQIDKFAHSIEARLMQEIYGEEAFVFPEDGYHGDDIKALASDYIKEHGDSIKDAPEHERLNALAEYGLNRNIPKMKSDLQRYGIVYDNWFFESQLHKGSIEETVKLLTDRGFTYENEGALWLKTSEILHANLLREGKTEEQIEKLELKDDVLRRSNGFYTYFAADIAYHRNKLSERGFDIAINIWGADHHGHVARLKGALDALGLDGEHRLEIILMQLVRLMRDGEVVRMSKRTGKAIALSDLLDEIPVDAARYFFNSRAADTHLEFDLGLAVRQDSDNPVYYVQYAHARCKSILKALSQEGIATTPVNPNFSLLTDPAEIDLIRELSKLPEEIRLAADALDPSRLNRYSSSCATAFHHFYSICRIKEAATEDLRDARISLVNCVAQVIENTLSTLGVSAPDHM
ncbi:MAG: arginine--tRNA ligase [Clostridiaceae bacterium]|nr:arginine--tRNA ligase [Clostridiaceae bacterium]